MSATKATPMSQAARRRRVLAVAVCAVLGLCGPGPAQKPDEIRRTPKFDGGTIPDPPEQRRAWTAPETKLPRFLARATALLFEQGVADPRGCEYREVEIGDALLFTTHGFVLPAPAGAAGRFAVGWDGVVYPAFRVGEAADLDADLRALVDAMKGRHKAAAAEGGVRGGDTGGFTGDVPSFFPIASKPIGPAAVETASALKVCLLLRLGRADLAEALFAAGAQWVPSTRAPDLTAYGVSYATLAREWADRAYNRAVDAHGRGDDAIALDTARRVAAFAAAAGPALDALGFAAPRGPGRAGEALPQFPNLRQLGDLVADQERRAKEPPRGPVPGPDASAEARVNALIRDLDQVAAAGPRINGMASTNGSETERALVREGDAVVGPLLAALESDDRLTRTVSYPGSRGGRDDRLIHYVFQTEHSALLSIMKTRAIPGATHLFWINDRAARRVAAEAIRAYWTKYRGVPEVERYFRTLADNGATAAQWLDAAEALSQPGDVRGRGGSYAIPHRVGGKVPPPRGEPLRDRKDPSVTELFARRVESIDPSASRQVPSQGSGDVFKVQNANRLARWLGEWDPKGAVPTLRARVARCVAIARATQGERAHHPNEDVTADIAALTLLRLKGDDPGALDDYSGWVRTVVPSLTGDHPVRLFEPLWRYIDRPAVAGAATALFGDPESRWVPLFRPGERGWGGVDDSKAGMITSPLLGVDSFRALLLAGLADLRETGSVTTDAAGKISERLDDGLTMFPVVSQDDPLRPAPSSTMPLRLADHYAWKLQGLEGTPRCELYWPQAKRDEAIAACSAFLRQYGPRFGWREASVTLVEAQPFYPQHVQAVLVFDRLDRPATPDDVREGRALFSLGAAEARAWPMPAYPMPARWTALEVPDDDPGLRAFDRSQGRPRAQIEMLQGGMVWQAEEVREGGRWRRYYGFVGRDALARVPAEEVEFPAPWNTGWFPVSAELDGRLIPPGGFDDGRAVTTAGPLPFEVWVRNRRGVESQAPTGWARTEAGLSLAEGLTLRLFRVPQPPAAGPGRGDTKPGDEAIPPRDVRRHRDHESSRPLAPTETARILRLDLRDLFPVERPGRYRLEVTCDAFRTAAGRLVTSFVVAEPGKPAGAERDRPR